MSTDSEVIKKKRGRKKKETTVLSNNITIIIEEPEEPIAQPQQTTEPTTKKRGRKPKGGKLIEKPQEKKEFVKPVTNIILHLKCSMLDLNEHNNQINQIVTDPLSYNPVIPPTIMTYNNNKTLFAEYKSNEISANAQCEQKELAYNEFDGEQIINKNEER
jgi:hypothetical protein